MQLKTLPCWNVFNWQELPLKRASVSLTKNRLNSWVISLTVKESVLILKRLLQCVKWQLPKTSLRYNGTVNQLAIGPFSQCLADLGQPLRELLSTKTGWIWGSDQEEAFNNIKTELSADTVFAVRIYYPKAKTEVSADASSHGLRAVLLQQEGNNQSHMLPEPWQRLKNATQKREALAAMWACDKFSDYLMRLHFTIKSDHKP